MKHLQEEELVGLVFDEFTGRERDACREHLGNCAQCASAVEALARAVSLLENAPSEVPPPFAWARLKARIDRAGTERDWTEPAWAPLILGHVAGIALVLLFISLAGSWLSTTPVWLSLRTWRLAAEIGPRGLIAILFFGVGALVSLALTPIFWWESRRRKNRVVC